MERLVINLYIHKDIKAALAKKLEKEKLRPGEYINQLIREDLNEGGCL